MVARFVIRIVILVAFATLGGSGVARSLVALLGMSALMCAGAGILRRESMLDSALSHWDEAAAYGLLCCLASALIQVPAP